MSNYNWVKIGEMMQKLIEDNTVDFNEEATYCIMRRYNPELPFSFDRYIKTYKDELGIDFVQRKEVLAKIFLNYDVDTRLKLLNYLLYYFHKSKVNRIKLKELENYLDENR
ncbi:hypothetical protein [uncultured Ilyobacter sp.]|jgi:hypothetical protein|uniref:hypothetical protein n=1 Tax=uncultured Ilyobacter sp. TaxID=544433 RepID=UPI0029BFF28F|nr:hypothetical protein [uncultured Ilyobacter sp.]